MPIKRVITFLGHNLLIPWAWHSSPPWQHLVCHSRLICSGEVKKLEKPRRTPMPMMYLHRGMWKSMSTIRKDSSYVDAFGNTGTQDNRNITIDVNTINSVRSSSSYSQLSWIVHFLQNLLAGSIVILTLLPICSAKILIYMMFAVSCYCLPIGNKWYVQKMSLLKARAPGVLPKVVATVVRMACIASARA